MQYRKADNSRRSSGSFSTPNPVSLRYHVELGSGNMMTRPDAQP